MTILSTLKIVNLYLAGAVVGAAVVVVVAAGVVAGVVEAAGVDEDAD